MSSFSIGKNIFNYQISEKKQLEAYVRRPGAENVAETDLTRGNLEKKIFTVLETQIDPNLVRQLTSQDAIPGLIEANKDEIKSLKKWSTGLGVTCAISAITGAVAYSLGMIDLIIVGIAVKNFEAGKLLSPFQLSLIKHRKAYATTSIALFALTSVCIVIGALTFAGLLFVRDNKEAIASENSKLTRIRSRFNDIIAHRLTAEDLLSESRSKIYNDTCLYQNLDEEKKMRLLARMAADHSLRRVI